MICSSQFIVFVFVYNQRWQLMVAVSQNISQLNKTHRKTSLIQTAVVTLIQTIVVSLDSEKLFNSFSIYSCSRYLGADCQAQLQTINSRLIQKALIKMLETTGIIAVTCDSSTRWKRPNKGFGRFWLLLSVASGRNKD